MKKTILVATGQQAIDSVVERFENYEVLSKVEYRNELEEACNFFRPEILLIGEGLATNGLSKNHEPLMGILLKLLKDYPNMRIIYLAGYVDLRDDAKVNNLGVLVMAGIYDIIHEKTLNVQMLKNILYNPKKEEDMYYLIKRVNNSNSKTAKETFIDFEIPEEDVAKKENQGAYDNLHLFTSIKPGTGKSFMSTNVATAIAQFGANTPDGKRPRVAIIEADLQNLSIGTLLQIEDEKKNLKGAMDKISSIVSKDGKFVGELKQVEEVNSYIHSCFHPYYRIKNLEALVGSQLTFGEISDIPPYNYVYLIESIIDNYDVIIVDSNSALTHVTTFPLLKMAKNCYYVLNLDFNNVRNNARYKETLNELGVGHKVKYILNEDIINHDEDSVTAGTEIEELIFTADLLDDSNFKLEARVPMLPKTVFLNKVYEGTPVVLDDKKYTLKARYEILKVANQLWPIKNFKEVEEQYIASKTKKKGGFFSK